MKEDRRKYATIAVALLLASAGLFWWSGMTASAAINDAFKPYNAALKEKHLSPMNVFPHAFRDYRAHDKPYPNLVLPPTGQPCASNCLAQFAVNTHPLFKTRFGGVPVGWGGSAGGVLVLLGIFFAVMTFRPNPRLNLINHRCDSIRIKTRGDTLPIIQAGRAQWGLMRRPDLKGAGRREFGNGIFVGKPGAGKSNVLKTWLLSSDLLNFIVVDLKGDLWNETAGHRATLGKVIRLNLSSTEGDAFDPLDTDQKADVMGVFEILLPTSERRTAHFNQAAQQIAAAYWGAARRAGRSAVPVLVRAAISSTDDMLRLARELVDSAPEFHRPQVLSDFRGAFSEVWDDPSKGSGGEKGSVLSSFRTAFAGLNTPGILSTLVARTFDPAELVDGRATLYITAPNTDAPYRAPLEMLLGAVVDQIFAHCDEYGAGEEIVILADEAGELKVPHFSRMLSTGRSRNVTLTAFIQDLGQLKQYHPEGWRGITDIIHHWTFWSTKNPQGHEFLESVCGKYDLPNPDWDRSQPKGLRYSERSAFEDMVHEWPQDRVLSVLDYDRKHVVYGEAVHPFNKTLQALSRITPPPLGRLPAPSLLTPPATTAKSPTPQRPKINKPPLSPSEKQRPDEEPETF